MKKKEVKKTKKKDSSSLHSFRRRACFSSLYFAEKRRRTKLCRFRLGAAPHGASSPPGKTPETFFCTPGQATGHPRREGATLGRALASPREKEATIASGGALSKTCRTKKKQSKRERERGEKKDGHSEKMADPSQPPDWRDAPDLLPYRRRVVSLMYVDGEGDRQALGAAGRVFRNEQ